MDDYKTIYLSPKCCDGGDGRQWCQDNVWPCTDCPEPAKAVASVYRLDLDATSDLAANMARDAQADAVE